MFQLLALIIVEIYEIHNQCVSATGSKMVGISKKNNMEY